MLDCEGLESQTNLYLSVGHGGPLKVLSVGVTKQKIGKIGMEMIGKEETVRQLAERGDSRGHRHKGHYGVESTRLEGAMETPQLGDDVINREGWARNTSVELGGLCRAGDDRWLEVEMLYGPLGIPVQYSEPKSEMRY